MKKEFFRILAPITGVEDVKLLKDAGADELYCGYVSEEFEEKWPSDFLVLNRRGKGQNFQDFRIFREAINQAHKNNLPVYVTINGIYTPKQYPLLFDLISKVEALEGIGGIIVSDLALLLSLRKNKFKKEIHISTGGTCFNSKTADFYSQLGAERVILPRQLTIQEIKSIFTENKSKIDVEIFIIREGCGGFIDGFCNFFHCYESLKQERIKKGVYLRQSYNTEQATRGCEFYFKERLSKGHFRTFNAKSYKEEKRSLKFKLDRYESIGCRICDLYELINYPIKSLKIIGRGHNPNYIARYVKLIYRLLSYLESTRISKKDYQRKCKDLFSKIEFNNERRCSKFDCYFSPHWIKNEK